MDLTRAHSYGIDTVPPRLYRVRDAVNGVGHPAHVTSAGGTEYFTLLATLLLSLLCCHRGSADADANVRA